MAKHYTRATVSAEYYCNKCGKMTQHSVTDRRLGHCLVCAEKLEAQHEAAKDIPPAAEQKGLFQ